MSVSEKYQFLNQRLSTFGLCYDAEQEIFITKRDFPKEPFNQSSGKPFPFLSLNTLYDTESIYFNYQKKTWLLRLWKGQYGISTCAGIGLYHADAIVPPLLRTQTTFFPAAKDEALPLTISLFETQNPLLTCSVTQNHLITLLPGKWCDPSALSAEIKLTFSDPEMYSSFQRGLTALGYSPTKLHLTPPEIQFTFSTAMPPVPPLHNDWTRSCILQKTRFLCQLYPNLTFPFITTTDRILFLLCSHHSSLLFPHS